MPVTYEPIATTTLGSAQATVTFSSIPATYTDLVLVTNLGGDTTAASLLLRVNGDSGSNYSTTVLYGTGSSALSAGYSNLTSAYAGQINTGLPAALSAISIIQIFNYANTTTNKTIISRYNEAGTEVNAMVSLWRSTSAINEVILRTASSSFRTNSTFTLYGIKSA